MNKKGKTIFLKLNVHQLKDAPCFSNNQAVFLLHDAFQSAARRLGKDESLCSLNKLQLLEVTEIIRRTIQFVVDGYGGSQPKWTEDQRGLVKKKMHSALFYFILKFNNIECSEASEYYCSVPKFPPFDWTLFFSILKTCHWSALYVNCVMQVPCMVAVSILSSALDELENSTDNSDYIEFLSHLLLQTLICKLLGFKSGITSDKHMQFHFHFKCSDDRLLTEEMIVKNDKNLINLFHEKLMIGYEETNLCDSQTDHENRSETIIKNCNERPVENSTETEVASSDHNSENFVINNDGICTVVCDQSTTGDCSENFISNDDGKFTVVCDETAANDCSENFVSNNDDQNCTVVCSKSPTNDCNQNSTQEYCETPVNTSSGKHIDEYNKILVSNLSGLPHKDKKDIAIISIQNLENNTKFLSNCDEKPDTDCDKNSGEKFTEDLSDMSVNDCDMQHNSINLNHFSKILSRLICDLRKCNRSLKLGSVLLNGLLTTFNLVLENKNLAQDFVFTNDFQQFCIFVHQYFQYDELLHSLSTELNNYKYFASVVAFSSEEKYNWPVGYLIFMLYELWQDIRMLPEWDKNEKLLHVLDDFIELLCLYHPVKLIDESSTGDEYIKLMISMINLSNLGGRTYAFQTVLKHEGCIKRKDVQSCLEAHCDLFQLNDSYLLLMEKAVQASDPEKERLSKLFLKIFDSLKFCEKQKVLRKLVSEFNISTIFKSSTFEQDFKMCLDCSVLTEEVLQSLPSFFLQSCEETLNTIISQRLLGRSVTAFIKALPKFSYICTSEKSTTNLPLLIEVMKPHFTTENLSKYNMTHVSALILELLKVFPGDSTFSRYHFLQFCIFPNLSAVSSVSNMRLCLELLNIILCDTLVTGYVAWFKDISSLYLMELISSTINCCITNSYGELKEDVISCLNTLLELHSNFGILETLETKDQQAVFLKQLLSLNSLVLFYVLDLIQQHNIDESKMPLPNLLSWCIIRKKDASILNECILRTQPVNLYATLILTMTQVMTHLATSEFESLASLLIGMDFLSPASELILKDESLQLLKDQVRLVNLTEVLVDSLLLLKKHRKVKNWSHIITQGFNPMISEHVKDMNCDSVIPAQMFILICKLAAHFEAERESFHCILFMLIAAVEKSHKDDIRVKKIILNMVNAAKTLPKCLQDTVLTALLQS